MTQYPRLKTKPKGGHIKLDKFLNKNAVRIRDWGVFDAFAGTTNLRKSAQFGIDVEQLSARNSLCIVQTLHLLEHNRGNLIGNVDRPKRVCS